MFVSRHIPVAAASVAMLASCSTTNLDNASLPAGEINVTEVTVSVDNMERTFGRNFDRSNAQIEADLEAALRKALRARSVPGGTPVDVMVDVKKLSLANPAARALGQVSSITADLTANAGDQVLVPRQEVVGETSSIRLAGALGAVTTTGVDTDYNETLTGFSLRLQQLLFKEQ